MTRTLITALAGLAMLALAPAAPAQTGNRFLIAETVNPDPQGNVLEVAAATGQFTLFLEAVRAAGLEETLSGEGPFTLFAPTDDAFRRMPRAERDRLLQPRNHEELLALITYHVAPERVTRASLDGRVERVEMANGYRATIDGREGLRINDQLAAIQDIEASNGVVHGINSVCAARSWWRRASYSAPRYSKRMFALRHPRAPSGARRRG
ncbi:MAG: fasciclin domain-containing protein [Hyphomonadaceae bacterium]